MAKVTWNFSFLYQRLSQAQYTPPTQLNCHIGGVYWVGLSVSDDPALQRGRHFWHLCSHNPWGWVLAVQAYQFLTLILTLRIYTTECINNNNNSNSSVAAELMDNVTVWMRVASSSTW